MQIFNTLTRQKEEFVPQVPGEYRIYVCGPTVYNYIHIGNARPLIVFDTLRRYLEYRGNKVLYVSNITDIDDKLIKKGQEEGTSMKEVAQRFEAEYLKDAAGLNCKKPTVQPRATEHIQQILDIVKDLIDSGHAYVAKNGDVYFRVKSDPEYGKLSHLKLDDLESGNRELRSQMDDDLKEDPADFAVWKAAKPGEPAWESPYGMGRPGWHIECSAMSRTHLGKTIDLHCGTTVRCPPGACPVPLCRPCNAAGSVWPQPPPPHPPASLRSDNRPSFFSFRSCKILPAGVGPAGHPAAAGPCAGPAG